VAGKPGVSVIATAGAITTLPIPAGNGDLVIYLTSATGAVIQGIAPGLNGQRLIVYGAAAATFTFAHLSGTPSSLARCINVATSAPTPITAGGSVTFVYDNAISGLWRMITHEQGGWITAPYNAADFVGSGSMTWTVQAADIATIVYRLSGRTVTMTFALDVTSVGGTLSTDLQIRSGQWGGFSIAGQFNAPVPYASEGGVAVAGAMIQTGGTILRILKQGFPNWTATTNTTAVYGQITFQVS
jgi:hypothetical protein